MSLAKVTRPYETLIRHNVDGSVAAHHIYITEITDTDDAGNVTIVSASLGDAMPLAATNDDIDFAAIMGDAQATALVGVGAYKAMNQDLLQQIIDLNASVTAAQNEVERISGEEGDILARNAYLIAEMGQAQADLATSQDDLATAEANHAAAETASAAALSDAQAQIADLSSQLQGAGDQIAALTASLAAANAQIALLSAQPASDA